LTPSEPSPGGIVAALERAARAQPEAPFLFYRNARGQFRWWSFSTAAAVRDSGGLPNGKLSVKGVVVEREAAELLGSFLLESVPAERSPAEVAAPLPPGPGSSRDVWISWRPPSHPAERFLAGWAIRSGAAIVVDPASALHPELVAWVRPTVLSGTAAELLELASQIEKLAPRLFRRLWLRQRGKRLRLLVVEGEASDSDLAGVGERWRSLSPHFSPSVVALDAPPDDGPLV
jgi:hypothetical protein